MTIESDTGVGCRVCGCPRIQIDEVEYDGILLLTECSRCQDRRTARPVPAGPASSRFATPAPRHSGGRSSHTWPAADAA